MINSKKIVIIFTAFLLIICSHFFSKTKGLTYSTGDGFVSESMSCDSDDDFNIEMGKIIFIPFIIFCFTIKRKIYVWEFIIGNLILFLQLFMIIAIEGGSIINTIQTGNFILLFWSISYVALFIELYSFFIFERINKNNNLSHK